ncbi:MAG: glycoside hydrolase family 3 C-terminal domain-containing protein [Cyclobacteriaceae bacterium]|nr:glycoside hydrolase family 3 C-terminal domain-containing protein [Cyclobacteriaceae bacterium]
MTSPRLTLIVAGLFSLVANAWAQTPQLGKNPVSEVVAAMTIEEKVTVLVGAGMYVPGMPFGGNVEPVEAQKRVIGAAGVVNGIPRLGIPSMVVCDGPAGVHAFNSGKSRLYYATAWPIGTLMASSWDTTMVKTIGAAYGQEAKEFGIDVILGPGLNIQRNPRGGRNFEYYSEDPVLTGNIASAMVKGIQSQGVGTSPKHFFANNQEWNRMTVDVVASERALREIYLKGWEILVKQAKPWTIMSSYNLVNGTYTSQDPQLLTNLLRDEWGYKGFVMTDWFGGRDAVAQMKAGNNLLMPGTPPQRQAILEAVKSGSLDVKTLDKNVTDILNIMMSSPTFNKYAYSDSPDLKKNAQLSRWAATESMVLLKNEQALPISSGSTVALFGNGGVELIAGGTGSGDVTKMYTISLAEGLFHAGIVIDPDLYTTYKAYVDEENMKHPKKSMMEEFMNPTPPIGEYKISADMIAKAAETNAHAIVAISRNAGEGTDRKVDGDYYLTETEKTLISEVSKAFHAKGKKVIVTLNIAAPVDVSQWRDNVDAILLAWQPGLEGGNAMADILTGKVNPSGKLTATFPVAYTDDPSVKNFPGKEFKDREVQGAFGQKEYMAQVDYEEGVYVGYRYYTTYGVKPAYEFGYGLSYTDFVFSGLNLSSATFADKITASVTVTNSGRVAGKEVVQLYISAPTGKLDKPAKELKAFAKTRPLQPGESQSFTFTLRASDLASYQTKISSWVADKGTYTISIGTSAQSKQTATFKVGKDIVVEKTQKLLTPKSPVNEMTGKK